ncbi:hypothetical protein FS837_003121 [Tulasnella sp. UAMH 9824]|nr:hypothetical protein FS837_003121 [Tulasnella sp. UAMH 9824]
MSPGEGRTGYPHSASIRIQSFRSDCAKVVYETESRRFAFEVWEWTIPEEVEGFHDLVKELRNRLKEPALNVTITDSFSFAWPFLESLGDQNVQHIEARLGGGDADYLLTALGAPMDPTDIRAANTSPNRSFESLKRIAIHEANIDLTRLTLRVETWQQNAQNKSKPWLDEVSLVGCHVREMELDDAFDRLKAIGVTLQSVGCLNFEEF